ncbi:MAG: flagellar biosynthesis anti-sigma factor FlgM [Nitrospiraceae bacterium]|nr:MAG: flagellar biosynthesis anti-sigma factor FlgM [Nitrospiraceae bacterium]
MKGGYKMRIDGNGPVDRKDVFNKIQEAGGSQEAEKKKGIEKQDEKSDRISLSGKAKEISELRALIDQLPEVRTDKVEAVKQAIDAGTYNIDPRKIAQKMLEEI